MADELESDAFRNTLLLMAVFGGESGIENMRVCDWTWNEGDVLESLEREADEIADEIAAFLDEVAEFAPASDRVAVQLVSLRGKLNLGHRQVESTLGAWSDAALRAALLDFMPKPWAPLTLIKVVTDEMLRENGGLWLDDAHWAIRNDVDDRAKREDPTAALAWRQARQAALEKAALPEIRSRLLGACAEGVLPSDGPLDARSETPRSHAGRALDLFDAMLFNLPRDGAGRVWVAGE